MATLQQVKQILDQRYDKFFAVSHANEVFKDLSSTRKEKIIRAMYLSHFTIRRMWENEGCLHWEVVGSQHHRMLEQMHYLGRDDPLVLKTYVVMVDRKLKWHCDCRWFSMHTDKDYCTHVHQVMLMNILLDYVNYFIYSYRFLLPNISYKKFLMDFVGHEELYT
jgi:hypothetical protein